jgi:hypothetical protein
MIFAISVKNDILLLAGFSGQEEDAPLTRRRKLSGQSQGMMFGGGARRAFCSRIFLHTFLEVV